MHLKFVPINLRCSVTEFLQIEIIQIKVTTVFMMSNPQATGSSSKGQKNGGYTPKPKMVTFAKVTEEAEKGASKEYARKTPMKKKKPNQHQNKTKK